MLTLHLILKHAYTLTDIVQTYQVIYTNDNIVKQKKFKGNWQYVRFWFKTIFSVVFVFMFLLLLYLFYLISDTNAIATFTKGKKQQKQQCYTLKIALSIQNCPPVINNAKSDTA